MAIAHVCMQCGMSLTRLRPSRDPHYHLPMVTCPSCNTVCTRSVHPLQRWHLTAIRVRGTLCALVLQILAAVALGWLMPAGAAWFGRQVIHGLPVALLAERHRFALALFGLAVPIATGVWLTAGLGHWRPATAWRTWIAVIVALLCVDTILIILADLPPATGVSWLNLVRREYELHVFPVLIERIASLIALTAMLVVATAGIPLGRGLRAAFARHRAHRWRKRRTRLRTRRAGI